MSSASHEISPLFKRLLDEYQRAPVIEHPHSVPANVRVSVCVPTYQHASTIEKCLDSILDQDSGFTYEILIGEDHSTDGTREICLKYASKHPDKIRLFLHSRENNISINGQPTGRFNLLYLLSQANGEYIALCEGDDWWTDRNKLRLQTQAMADAPACHVSCHPASAESLHYSKSGGVFGYHGNEKKILPASDAILIGGGFCPTLSIMFRRDIVSSLPEWLLHAPVLDYYLMALASSAGGCLYIPGIMGAYGYHAGSGSWTSRMLSNPEFAVDYETSFLAYLDRLADEMDASNKQAVAQHGRQKRWGMLFARHLPRWFRIATYQDIKPTLSLNERLAWYLSVFGWFPGFALHVHKIVKPLARSRT